MIIYLRHAEKCYTNGKSLTYKHDSPITKSGVDDAQLVASRLFKQFGTPEKILSSPYERTRVTAYSMSKKVKEVSIDPIYYRDIPIYIDLGLSEYLGNHPNEELDVTEGTALYHPPHPENFHDFKKRVSSHIDELMKELHKYNECPHKYNECPHKYNECPHKYNECSPLSGDFINEGKKIPSIWAVTHGLTLKTIIKELTGVKVKLINYLDTVIVTLEKVILLQFDSGKFIGREIPIKFPINPQIGVSSKGQ